ncbi:hypothetical protein GCM10010483_56420 [Actinokineospora diospyrosa]
MLGGVNRFDPPVQGAHGRRERGPRHNELPPTEQALAGSIGIVQDQITFAFGQTGQWGSTAVGVHNGHRDVATTHSLGRGATFTRSGGFHGG